MATCGMRRLLCSIAVILTVTLFASSVAGADSLYGRGAYGKCSSSRACATTTTPTPTPTVVTLDSGLKVSINLKDGQKIPRGGYAITVTPLNGQGATFDHVDISIDGQLMTTAQPDPATGGVRWVWDTLQLPGSVVTVVVTATDGQVVTNTYHVRIVDASQLAVPSTVVPEDTSGSGAQAYINHAVRIINKLPAPVVKSFPYFLFLILLANFVLLSLQMRHEVREYGVAKRLLDRQREVADAKRVLMELISHYLRTPLTLLAGGVDMIAAQPLQTTLNKLRQGLAEKIERLIGQTRDAAAVVDELPVVRGASPKMHFWLHPVLSLPIILIGLVVVMFDYLAHRAKALNVSQTNLLVQALLFFTLVLLTYLAFRYLHLRRRDARELAQVAQAETAVTQARDDLVLETAGLLQQDIAQLGTLAAQLPASEGAGYIRESHGRLTALLQKVQLASGLRSARSTGPASMVPLDQLLQEASAGIAKTAASRHVTLPSGTTALVPSRDPALLRTVVASLLDNAVAYSPENAVVEAKYQADAHDVQLTIVDHGNGIPADKLHDLFLPFQKLEGVDTFNHEGMGFSLYLDRLIMAYLGGAISAASSPTDGTQITLRLPLAPDGVPTARA